MSESTNYSISHTKLSSNEKLSIKRVVDEGNYGGFSAKSLDRTSKRSARRDKPYTVPQKSVVLQDSREPRPELYRPENEEKEYYTRFSRARMLEITCNDRLGKKVRVKCNSSDTVGDLKKLIAAQTGTRAEKIVLKKWYTIFKDHITLGDSDEIRDGANLELYYQ